MIQVSKLVSNQTLFSFPLNSATGIASEYAVEDQQDSFLDSLNGDCQCPFFPRCASVTKNHVAMSDRIWW